jgi:hypothetical protein
MQNGCHGGAGHGDNKDAKADQIQTLLVLFIIKDMLRRTAFTIAMEKIASIM